MIDLQTSLAIQSRALHSLSERQRRESSLYINEQPVPFGTRLGPAYENIVVRHHNAVLIFEDANPTANFAHECRYLLFDAATTALIDRIPARFPPYHLAWPKSYRWFGGWKAVRRGRLRRIVQFGFHLPLRFLQALSSAPEASESVDLAPTAQTSGRRLAVLFCGNPDPAHVNTMEFCYRMLVQTFGFATTDIRVLFFEGVLTTPEWNGLAAPPMWSGDDTSPFQLPVSGGGCRPDLLAALAQLNPNANDLLFIFTTGHGGGELGKGSYLATREAQQDVQYFASQFGADLQSFQVRQLLVLMQQCFAGGFQCPVMQNGNAAQIAFACAAGSVDESYNSDDVLWNSFATDWFAAFEGRYPNQDSLNSPADTGDGRISALEAFVYATRKGRPHELDTPCSAYSTAPAKRVGLDGQ